MCGLTLAALLIGLVAACFYAASRLDGFGGDLTDTAKRSLDRVGHRAPPRREPRP
jgi:hypothetical protein